MDKYSILIVDDDTTNIMALTHMLSDDYTLYIVKDGISGIKTAKEQMPDLVLLDVIMPGMDGYAVLAALKADKKTKDIPVIIISGLSDTESEGKGFALGAVDYIIKPFTSAIVKLRVANQINLIKQRRIILEKEIREKSAHAQMEFLMNMNHEMLTPMNAIMGMTQLAKMSKNPAKIAECLDEIDTASRQLLKLLESLLSKPAGD